jgi:hypothetical protein
MPEVIIGLTVSCGSKTAPGLDGLKDRVIRLSIGFDDEEPKIIDVLVYGQREAPGGGPRTNGDDTGDIMGRIALALDSNLSAADRSRISVEVDGDKPGNTRGRLVIKDPTHVDCATTDGKIRMRAFLYDPPPPPPPRNPTPIGPVAPTSKPASRPASRPTPPISTAKRKKITLSPPPTVPPSGGEGRKVPTTFDKALDKLIKVDERAGKGGGETDKYFKSDVWGPPPPPPSPPDSQKSDKRVGIATLTICSAPMFDSSFAPRWDDSLQVSFHYVENAVAGQLEAMAVALKLASIRCVIMNNAIELLSMPDGSEIAGVGFETALDPLNAFGPFPWEFAFDLDSSLPAGAGRLMSDGTLAPLGTKPIGPEQRRSL